MKALICIVGKTGCAEQEPGVIQGTEGTVGCMWTGQGTEGTVGCRGEGQGTEGLVDTNVEPMAGSKAAEGSFGVSACRAHESGNSDGTEVTDVGTSTHLKGRDTGAMSCNIC
ncbi:unnamed protein product, partial [Staurois parvus]